jgi:hypothetical protein
VPDESWKEIREKPPVSKVFLTENGTFFGLKNGFVLDL